MQCTQPAIAAHSIQNSTVLEHLARNGHVVTFKRRATKDDYQVDLGLVGRDQATTFTGLCEKHDCSLFRPIETRPITSDDPEQLFLLSYRAVLREAHVTMEGAMRAQLFYQERIRLSLDPSGPCPAGDEATKRIIIGLATNEYKQGFDRAYLASDFSHVTHTTITFNDQPPTLAASALFSIDEHQSRRGDVLRVALTIVPLARDRTLVLFSYLSADASLARHCLDWVFNASGQTQKYQVSRLLLNSCDNFVLAPDYVDAWPAEKREGITTYFKNTIFENRLEHESAHYYLF